MSVIDPVDEGRHSPGEELLWNESYYFDWFAPDGSSGGYVRVGFYPNLHKVWYWACCVRQGAELVTLIEHDIALPASPSSLELRGDGVWADHVVETPLEHMSINLESFALCMEDPAAVYRREYGTRVPFGCELDFVTDGFGYQWPPITPRYEIPCVVTGTVQIGQDTIEVDGFGQRDHSWGAARDWWSTTWNWTAGRFSDGSRFHSAGAFAPGQDFGVAYLESPDRRGLHELSSVRVEVADAATHLPERTTVGLGDVEVLFAPTLFSPVLLVSDVGQRSYFPRALASARASDGRDGWAWIEWNQPEN